MTDGYGGGLHEGLRAEGLQDAEASLAGDDGGDDLGDPSEPVEAQQVVVDKEPHEGTVPEIMIWNITRTRLKQSATVWSYPTS